LGSGAELWSVREHARRRATTASTINRAYRCLAEHKVIVLADRRRARVADGALAAARFLEPDRVFRLAGSDDPARPPPGPAHPNTA
jgi:DNA-binding transcriptional regulator YhcF (GntR family)